MLGEMARLADRIAGVHAISFRRCFDASKTNQVPKWSEETFSCFLSQISVIGFVMITSDLNSFSLFK
jgi:hypothetical protein